MYAAQNQYHYFNDMLSKWSKNEKKKTKSASTQHKEPVRGTTQIVAEHIHEQKKKKLVKLLKNVEKQKNSIHINDMYWGYK